METLKLVEGGWSLGYTGSRGCDMNGFYDKNLAAGCPKCGEVHYVNKQGKLQVNGWEMSKCINCGLEVKP